MSAERHALAGAQYLRSTDPEVIAVIERNNAAIRDYMKRAEEFAAKYRKGDYHEGEKPGWYEGGWFGRGVSAIVSREKPTDGQWTRGYGGRGWRPFKNNPAYAEMQALYIKLERYPGLPQQADSRLDRDGRRMTYTLHPFAHDGSAWVDCRTPLHPEEQRRDGMPDERWHEVKASEFFVAKEAIEGQP